MAETLIAKLSDEELSRWIAERLEPQPVWTHSGKSREYLGTYYSDGHCWQVRFELGERRDQQPRDMIHDPAMTVMLMEKEPICATRAGKKLWVAFKPDFRLSGPGLRDDWPHHDRLGRAVAEAFALANGWKT